MQEHVAAAAKTVSPLEPNLVRVNLDGREIFLIGTAHVSRASADLVERVIREIEPDLVCVELCEPRLESLQNPDKWRQTDIVEVIRSGRLYVLMAQLALSAFQKRLAAKFGIKPGEEMRRALSVSDELSIPVRVIDREVKITLRRAWSRAGFWNFVTMIASLIASLFSKEEIAEEDIEKMKEGDALAAMMGEFSDALPGVKEALIDERDRYMAAEVSEHHAPRSVVIVGAGHLEGIVKNLGQPIDIEELKTLPPQGALSKSVQWVVPAAVILLAVWGALSLGTMRTLELLGTWAAVNGLGSAIATALTIPHPLTILTAFFSAPFAALHPLIAVGWICALVEAMLRPPRVVDFERISDDVCGVRTFVSNRVTKLFLIMLFANLGSIFGSVIGIGLAVQTA